MRSSRWLVLGLVAVAALGIAGGALAVGPWPGLARTVFSPSGEVRYTAVRAGGATTIKAIQVVEPSVLASARIRGSYGIPAVTIDGAGGGLSPDGRLLVLVAPPTYQGLRAHSTFQLVSTSRLRRAGTIVLPGEFGFDAISPDGRTLYLIQHTSTSDLVRYVVRAYDLRTKRLLPGAITDPREPGEAMKGYPVARATSQHGAWVYTLYLRMGAKPFVHALDAARRTAFCIDLPWTGSTDDVWNARLELASGGGVLQVRSGGAVVAQVDTKTLRVSVP